MVDCPLIGRINFHPFTLRSCYVTSTKDKVKPGACLPWSRSSARVSRISGDDGPMLSGYRRCGSRVQQPGAHSNPLSATCTLSDTTRDLKCHFWRLDYSNHYISTVQGCYFGRYPANSVKLMQSPTALYIIGKLGDV